MFGFNGQMKVNEWSGVGNFMEFSERGYDSRIGRFLRIDPVFHRYPYNSSYAFAENDVIRCKDLEGGERLDVIANGSPELGNPANATITIKMDYEVVTDGRGTVNSPPNPQTFHDRFVDGNITMYMTSLPTKNAEGVFLTGKHERLARRAESGNARARKKLEEAGIKYYNADVFYDYSLNVQSCKTYDEAYVDMQQDRQGRGIIMQPGSTKDFNLLNTDKAVTSINLMANKAFKNPNVGGIATNSSIPDHDIANIVVLPGDARSGQISGTLRSVHEAGHNAAEVNVHNSGNYEYNQNGLQSNTNPRPSKQNTKDIINDKTNRQTIANP